jgi:hypothetical protein
VVPVLEMWLSEEQETLWFAKALAETSRSLAEMIGEVVS